MALTAKLLQLRPISRPIRNPSFTRFFSDEPNRSTNSTTTDSDATSSPSQWQSSFSSYSSDGRPPSSYYFRPISFPEWYQRNVISKGRNVSNNTNQLPAGESSLSVFGKEMREYEKTEREKPIGDKDLRESLWTMKVAEEAKKKSTTSESSLSVFGKEMRENEKTKREKLFEVKFIDEVTYEDLRESLPIGEDTVIDEVTFEDLSERLWKMKVAEDDKKKSTTSRQMKSESQDSRGPGKKKRKWGNNEDSALVTALVGMVNCGLCKADNGFKRGYLNYLEEKLQVSLPTAGLKARPHIDSRIKLLKRDFCIVYDMITSGFGMDPVTKCLTAEKEVWDTYLQSHPRAAMWKTKAFPFWDELIQVFGKDRATGENAGGPTEMMEEIEREEAENEVNNCVENATNGRIEDLAASQSFMDMQSPRSKEVSTQKKKKRKSDDHVTIMMDGIQNAASIIGNEIAKATEVFSRAIGVDAMLSEKRQQIHSEVRKVPNIPPRQVIKAVCHIARDHELTDVFFSMTVEDREELVRAILVGDV